MKFRNGHWLYKEGYACFSPRQVYEITREDGALELCAPTSLITGRMASSWRGEKRTGVCSRREFEENSFRGEFRYWGGMR